MGPIIKYMSGINRKKSVRVFIFLPLRVNIISYIVTHKSRFSNIIQNVQIMKENRINFSKISSHYVLKFHTRKANEFLTLRNLLTFLFSLFRVLYPQAPQLHLNLMVLWGRDYANNQNSDL